ncbi:MAG: hypothetical protein AB1744_03415 [Candidatus Zixiibacteriota bacterium]
MEVSNAMWIDLVLNLIGFLAAAAALLVLQSMWRDRRRARTEAVTPQSVSGAEAVNAGRSGDRRRLEFIRLGETAPPAGQSEMSTKDPTSTPRLTAAQRRDRLEIIKLARRMLDAGATTDRVKAVLPLSDGELALLSNGRR